MVVSLASSTMKVTLEVKGITTSSTSQSLQGILPVATALLKTRAAVQHRLLLRFCVGLVQKRDPTAFRDRLARR